MWMPRFPLPLILSVGIIQVLTLALILLNSHTQTSAERQARLSDAVQTQSLFLAGALAPALAANNHSALLDALELLKDDRRWRYAGVYDDSRRLLASLGDLPPLTQPLTQDYQYRYSETGSLLAIEQPITARNRILGLLEIGYAVPPAETALLSGNHLIALTGLLLTGVALGIFGWPLRAGLHHIQTVVQALRDGQWQERTDLPALHPLAPLATTLDELAQSVQSGRDRLRSQYDQLLQESRRLGTLLTGLKAIVWEASPEQGWFTYVSPEAEHLLGHPVAAWLTPDFCQKYIHPDDADWLQTFLRYPGRNVDQAGMDFRLYDHAGTCLWLRMISTLEMRDQGPVAVGILLNVTEERNSEQHLAYLSNHDPLTGLVNRSRFQQQLQEAVSDSQRHGLTGTLLYLDLDQFKFINDTFGHHTGDEYLRQFARHLRDTLTTASVVGRLGGDEFGVIFSETSAEQAATLSQNLIRTLNAQEFRHLGQAVAFSASIGIALFPEHSELAGDLLAKADAAMYNAKDQGRNTYRLFQEQSDAGRMEQKLYWEGNIRAALRDNRFRLYFQPIVELDSGLISHYETLLRMLGEDGKVIAPGAFIGVAERFGLIRDIDRWVVRNAIRVQGLSNRQGRPMSLTINLSGRHLGDAAILDVIERATSEAQADPGRIVFEVTETAAVGSFNEARTFIRALHDRGYRFALDDFGAGFSSFDYLKHLPVDYIKIDGSFVRNLHQNRFDRVFVGTIAEMAKNLGVKAVAEFVENRETVDLLKELGVPLGQGYYFAKPAPRFHELDRVILKGD